MVNQLLGKNPAAELNIGHWVKRGNCCKKHYGIDLPNSELNAPVFSS